MTNIQSSNRINAKSNTVGISQQQTIELDKQSPEELKRQLESGELNETDFPSKDEFNKFVMFLSKMIQAEIKLSSKNMDANVTSKAELALKNNSEQQNKEQLASLNNKTAAQNDLKAEYEKTAVVQGKPNHALEQNNDTDIQKELFTNLLPKQATSSIKMSNEPVATQQANVGLFSADNVEKTIGVKEHSLQIGEKAVTLHTSGGNNLSMIGNDVTAQGDIQFLNETRGVAEEEGFKEKGQQRHQDEEENSNLDSVYFTKDNEQ